MSLTLNAGGAYVSYIECKRGVCLTSNAEGAYVSYLDWFEQGRIIACVLSEYRPYCVAGRTQSVQNGRLVAGDAGKVRVYVKRVDVTWETVEGGLWPRGGGGRERKLNINNDFYCKITPRSLRDHRKVSGSSKLPCKITKKTNNFSSILINLVIYIFFFCILNLKLLIILLYF